jgi:predicted CopG family antitoxin
MKPLSCWLVFAVDEQMHSELEAFARLEERSVSDVLRRLVRETLEKARTNQGEAQAAS